MIKYFVICPVVFLMFIGTLQAQDEQPQSKWYNEGSFSIGTPSLNNTDTYLTTWAINGAFGYELSPKFSLKIPVALSWNLFYNTKNNSTSYRVDGLAGLAAGYYLGNNKRWQLTAEAGHTISDKSCEWNNFYYDLGGRYYLDTSHIGYYGFGIRQYISEIKGMPNYFMLHFTIGLKEYNKRR